MALITGTAAQVEAQSTPFLLGGADVEPQIIVNNRILAKVNGKGISVMDLMKKMDMSFYRQYPEYASLVQARFHYYQANWKHVLEEIVDKELILADAEESKLVVSNGDVRQEMESLFGPNIITNLDKVDLTFDEAFKMILADITIRRMMYFRVQSKAITQVTPQTIRKYYDEVAKDNIRDNEWVYRVISIRHRNPTTAAEMANMARHLLTEENLPLDELSDKLKAATAGLARPATFTVSEEFRTKEKELSDSFKQALAELTPNSYSAPIVQKSRADNSTIFRIFYLKDMHQGGIVPFRELEAKIKDRLIDQAIAKESDAYLNKLRQHFDVQDGQLKELLSSEYQPFSLK